MVDSMKSSLLSPHHSILVRLYESDLVEPVRVCTLTINDGSVQKNTKKYTKKVVCEGHVAYSAHVPHDLLPQTAIVVNVLKI